VHPVGFTIPIQYECYAATDNLIFLQTAYGLKRTLTNIHTRPNNNTVDIQNWLFFGGPGNSVGITTGYGLDGPGIESRWGRDFPHLSRPSLLWNGYRFFPEGRKWPGRDADPSPPSLKTSVGLYLYIPLGPSWPVKRVKRTYCFSVTVHDYCSTMHWRSNHRPMLHRKIIFLLYITTWNSHSLGAWHCFSGKSVSSVSTKHKVFVFKAISEWRYVMSVFKESVFLNRCQKNKNRTFLLKIKVCTRICFFLIQKNKYTTINGIFISILLQTPLWLTVLAKNVD
jgi:hypothetical protein